MIAEPRTYVAGLAGVEICPRCNERPKSTTGIRSYCKPCGREYQREWRKGGTYRRGARLGEQRLRDREYNREANRRRTRRMRETRAALLLAQGGACAACAIPLTLERYGARLDHDHSCCPGDSKRACGECWRGVVCSACNAVARDTATPAGLRASAAEHRARAIRRDAVAAYLERWQSCRS